MTDTVEAVARAIREAAGQYYVSGTSKNDNYLPPFIAPWYVIDGSTAEPDVNWPGELIASYDDGDDASRHRDELIAQAAIAAHLAALEAQGMSEAIIEALYGKDDLLWERSDGTKWMRWEDMPTVLKTMIAAWEKESAG